MRAGVHTGEVELIDDDVSGTAVIFGARIGALAILVGLAFPARSGSSWVGSGWKKFAERGVH